MCGAAHEKRGNVLSIRSLATVAVTALVALSACGDDTSSQSTTPASESTAAAASTPVAGGDLEKVTLQLDWTWLGYHMAFLYAQDAGLFAAEGLDVEIIEGSGSTNTVKTVATGQAEFGFADSSALVQGIGAGADLRNALLVWREANFGTICSSEANVKEPKDLEGKSVLLIPSENVAVMWPVFVQTTGIDVDKVNVVNADYTNKEALFVAGEADCMAGVVGQDILLVQYQRPELSDDNVLKWNDYGVNNPGHGVIVTNKLINSSPDVVQGFVSATIKGFEVVCADPQIGVDLYNEKFPTADENTKKFAIDNLPYECDKMTPPEGQGGERLGVSEEATWQALVDNLVKYGELKDPPAAADVFTNDFVD